jgi:hypothetical protein
LVVCGYLSWAAPVSADVVTDWNAIATPSILTGVPTRFGGTSFLDFAMVHLAMHDAIQAFEGRYESYGAPIPGATGSPVAAAASAAHAVLVNRFPAQAGSLDTTLLNYLTGLGLLGDPGVVIGQDAAAEIIALRTGDGSWPSNPEVFIGGTAPGEWRPTPPAFLAMQVPWLGSVIPFALKDSGQLLPAPPPLRLTSGDYAEEYNEVKALGRATNSSRTAEQTALALFYTDSFIAQGERYLRGVAGTVDDIGANGRLFALANLSAADAVITAWNAKRLYNYWRPITAIQQGDNDGNPDTAGDPTWVPLVITPAYPDYTSGANSITGAFTRTLALLLGDKTTFIVTNVPRNETKTYERFSDLASDIVDVRIYQGLHFRAADAVARRDAKRSADWAVSHVLRPL